MEWIVTTLGLRTPVWTLPNHGTKPSYPYVVAETFPSYTLTIRPQCANSPLFGRSVLNCDVVISRPLFREHSVPAEIRKPDVHWGFFTVSIVLPSAKNHHAICPFIVC